MTSPNPSESKHLTGSCPCTTISWKTTIPPQTITICHCTQCRTISTTTTPIAYSSFPNTAVHFSDTAATSKPATASADLPNITVVETERAARGACKRCDVVIYMKYHCWPEITDLNVGLCDDEAVLERVRGAKMHIFFDGEVGEGEEAYRGFNDEFAEAMEKWECEGKKKRADL